MKSAGETHQENNTPTTSIRIIVNHLSASGLNRSSTHDIVPHKGIVLTLNITTN